MTDFETNFLIGRSVSPIRKKGQIMSLSGLPDARLQALYVTYNPIYATFSMYAHDD